MKRTTGVLSIYDAKVAQPFTASNLRHIYRYK